MLVTAGSTEGTLGVWDVASGRNLAALTTVPGGGATSAASTPGGTLLVEDARCRFVTQVT